MPTVRQASFTGGEVAPLLYGRTDHPRYGVSVRKLLNFIALPQGAAQNRPGTKFVASTKDPTQKAIQVPFVFSTTQTYVLEFGNLYIRFIQNGGLVLNGGIPYEIVSPFTTAMLPYLKWAQSGDILTLDYGGQDVAAAQLVPQELRRLGHTNWTIGAVSFAPPAATNPIPSVVSGPNWSQLAYNAGFNYMLGDRVTSGNQSWVSIQNNNLGNLPAAASAFWTLANDGTHAAVAWSWVITSVFRENATGTVYEGGLSPVLSYTDSLQDPDRPLTILPGVGATLPPGYTALANRIYRGKNGSFGFIDQFTTTSYTDTGKAPDYSQQPPKSTNPFANPANDYPSVVCFFEQRRIFARQGLHPSRIQGSRIGQISNFDVDLFVQADDAISFDLSSLTLDEIRSLVPLTSIFALTQSGVWSVRGFQGSALSPTSVNARKQHDAAGASWVNPARVGDTIVYEQDGGGAVWVFTYDPLYDVGRASDISIVASHFFEGHTVVRIVYSARPRKTIWLVRDDGLLVGCTYVPGEVPVLAWHQHTTDGVIEDACVVPEGTEDALYLLVKRTVNGATVRYHERMPTRLVTDARLGVFLDAALSFDGRNTGATTMKATGATYNGGDEVTVLASAPSFVADDVGSAIVLDPNAAAGGPFPMTILAFTDATHVTARLETNLAAAFQNVATTSWGFGRRRFNGLGHLEGKTVAVLADGGVATAAKQDSSLVVTAGQIAIDTPAVIVHAGLPYVSDLELLDVAGEKLKEKAIDKMAFEVVASRGLWTGQTFDKLREWKQRQTKDAWGNPSLTDGLAEVTIDASWNKGARAVLRQIDPLPLTVVAAIREISVGGK